MYVRRNFLVLAVNGFASALLGTTFSRKRSAKGSSFHIATYTGDQIDGTLAFDPDGQWRLYRDGLADTNAVREVAADEAASLLRQQMSSTFQMSGAYQWPNTVPASVVSAPESGSNLSVTGSGRLTSFSGIHAIL